MYSRTTSRPRPSLIHCQAPGRSVNALLAIRSAANHHHVRNTQAITGAQPRGVQILVLPRVPVDSHALLW